MTISERELRIDAVTDHLPQVLTFLEEQLEAAGCPMKAQMQIALAAEEIFVNIASYAYAPGTGMATVRVGMEEAPQAVTITFADRGIPYDPLKKEDPDVTLPADERGIGGLGIFMVKKTMDDVSYVRQDGQNILKLTKLL